MGDNFSSESNCTVVENLSKSILASCDSRLEQHVIENHLNRLQEREEVELSDINKDNSQSEDENDESESNKNSLSSNKIFPEMEKSFEFSGSECETEHDVVHSLLELGSLGEESDTPASGDLSESRCCQMSVGVVSPCYGQTAGKEEVENQGPVKNSNLIHRSTGTPIEQLNKEPNVIQGSKGTPLEQLNKEPNVTQRSTGAPLEQLNKDLNVAQGSIGTSIEQLNRGRNVTHENIGSPMEQLNSGGAEVTRHVLQVLEDRQTLFTPTSDGDGGPYDTFDAPDIDNSPHSMEACLVNSVLERTESESCRTKTSVTTTDIFSVFDINNEFPSNVLQPKRKRHSKGTNKDGCSFIPAKIHKKSKKGNIYCVEVGEKLREFLDNHQMIQGIYLNKGKRHIKKELVELRRQDNAVDKSSWHRGNNIHERNRLDDFFELTEEGRKKKELVDAKKVRDEFAVNLVHVVSRAWELSEEVWRKR